VTGYFGLPYHIKSYFCSPIQHWVIGLPNRTTLCSLWGRNREQFVLVFKGFGVNSYVLRNVNVNLFSLFCYQLTLRPASGQNSPYFQCNCCGNSPWGGGGRNKRNLTLISRVRETSLPLTQTSPRHMHTQNFTFTTIINWWIYRQFTSKFYLRFTWSTLTSSSYYLPFWP
jgi:hypothetical protein